MNTQPERPIRLAAIGMDQRQRSALRKLFMERCDNHFVLMVEESSEICILDLDNHAGESLWEEFRERHPQRPLILVSLKSREVSDPYALFLKKPVPIERLFSAIDLLRQHPPTDEITSFPADAFTASAEADKTAPVETRGAKGKADDLMGKSVQQNFVSSMPDIDPDDPGQLSKIYYDPEQYLQHQVQLAMNLAVRQNKDVAIEGRWPEIKLDITNRTIHLAGNDRQLRSFCTIPVSASDVQLSLIGGRKGESGQQHHTEYTIEAFLWKLALWASRGRLPKGTDLFQPIYLRSWPNFTRLVVTPHALAIAALWIKQPHSLIETAETLNIPQSNVFAFYSAAKAIHLAGETRRLVDTFIAPPALEESKHRGAFGRLLTHLKGRREK
ncbi:MAG: hypothetical protein GY934_12055 [Gammaproteobacteria bacterium]|nr:hypothetical protein [Gammaproteobacteria bacterium]